MTLYPNFNPHSASEKIVENGTTYIIQHGRRYRADPPYRFIGVEPSGMHPENSLLTRLLAGSSDGSIGSEGEPLLLTRRMKGFIEVAHPPA